jgi:serum/glucocorticoid-regulated kinase 2
MEKIKVLDKVNFICDKQYQKVMKPDEKLFWSGESFKINNRAKRQNRVFLITNMRLINVGKRGNLITNMFSRLIRRELNLTDIEAVTYSKISNNFVLHLPKSYDCYLCTPDKDEIIEFILKIREENKLPDLKIYFVEEIDLMQFTKFEKEPNDKHPNVTPETMNSEKFEKYRKNARQELENNINNTETIISPDGHKVNEGSFEILRTLGKGYFGRVFLVEKKDTKKLYALKVISKLDIIKRNFFDGLKNEKSIMEKVNNPFVVNLDYCFANPSYIFFAMQFKQGGELYYHLRKNKRFNEKAAKFYASQILEGLSYLHSLGIMYRDMKPENILLDENGNACLADFGISKVLKENEKTKSFVGTPEYVAPEIILQKGHDKSVDIWCLGILLYEMVYGLPPFYNKNQNVMLNWVVKLDPTFPKSIKISEDLEDLIKKLLQKEPSKRIGFNNISEIKEHPWFKDINWEEVMSLKIQPPIKPEIGDKFDIENFNQDIIKEKPALDELKDIDQNIIDSHQEKFKEF